MNADTDIKNYTEILLFPGWWDDTPLSGYETDGWGLTRELAEVTQARGIRHSFRDETEAEGALRDSLQEVFALGRASHPRIHNALKRLSRNYIDGRLHNFHYRQEGREEAFEEEYHKIYDEELTRFLKENILPL